MVEPTANSYCYRLLKPKLQRLPLSFSTGDFFPKENLWLCFKTVFGGKIFATINCWRNVLQQRPPSSLKTSESSVAIALCVNV